MGIWQGILDTRSSSDVGGLSVAARGLQRELSRTAQTVGQMPSRAGSVSDGSDRESDDGDASSLSGKGKGKRRTSVAQTGAADSRATSPALPSPAPVQTMLPPPPKPLGLVAIDENGYQSLPNANEEARPATFNQPWTDEEQVAYRLKVALALSATHNVH